MKDQVNITQLSLQTTAPIIAGIEITTDSEGRFNLNALHKASGGQKSKAPNEWLRTIQAKELITTLEEQTGDLRSGQKVVNSVNGGVAPGTFAHELLAISYAGWISPRFQLQVNQAFLDSKRVKRPELTDIELLELALEAAKEREALKLINQEQAEEIADLKTLFKDGLTAPQFARMLNGVNVQQMNNHLVVIGWIYRVKGKKGGYKVASYARDKYMTERENIISLHGRDSFVTATPILLKSGAKKLYDAYRKGELPMKQSWDGSYTHLKLDAQLVAA